MKLANTFKVVALLGLVIGANEVRATECCRLIVSLSVFQENACPPPTGDISICPPIQKTQVTSSSLLAFLENELGQDFPANAFIELCPAGTSSVRTRDTILANTSANLFADNFEFDAQTLFQGTENFATGTEKSKAIDQLVLHVVGAQNGGTNVVVDGLFFENFKAGPEDSSGTQRVHATIKSKVAGGGTWNSDPDALIQGNLVCIANGRF